jgi:hypothetical protein
VYFASFLVTETNLAMGHGFICSACKEARFCWQLFSAELMSYSVAFRKLYLQV